MRNKIITNLKYLDCDNNSHLLLAVSGGIDSMVMLHFFQQNTNFLLLILITIIILNQKRWKTLLELSVLIKIT